MPNPVCADIRIRFEALFARGLASRDMRRRLMVSGAFVSRLPQKRRPGLRLTPAETPRNTGHGKLVASHDFLIKLMRQNPDITLKELRGTRLTTSAPFGSWGTRTLAAGRVPPRPEAPRQITPVRQTQIQKTQSRPLIETVFQLPANDRDWSIDR